MKIKISADSTCDLSPELIERYHIGITPLYIIRGEETLRDGIDVRPEELYEYANATGKLCKTAAVNVSDYLAYFAACREEYDAVIHFTISSDMSACYQNACIAAQEFTNVYPVDSRNLSTGIGHLVLDAAEMAEQGMDAADIASALEKKREKLDVSFVIDTLEYLKRGGRISKTVAFAGGLLSIKPVVTIQDGEIALIGKARGSRQGNNLLVEKIHACGGIDFQLPILLGYTGLSDAFLRKYVDDSRALWEHGTDSLDEALISGVIGTHAGPGAVAVAFFRKV